MRIELLNRHGLYTPCEYLLTMVYQDQIKNYLKWLTKEKAEKDDLTKKGIANQKIT